nr:MAG TPA: hypothetical protein [Caudoviricetes sp.]
MRKMILSIWALTVKRRFRAGRSPAGIANERK